MANIYITIQQWQTLVILHPIETLIQPKTHLFDAKLQKVYKNFSVGKKVDLLY
jgi:hypothetical protein